jgi:hypothetical protein
MAKFKVKKDERLAGEAMRGTLAVVLLVLALAATGLVFATILQGLGTVSDVSPLATLLLVPVLGAIPVITKHYFEAERSPLRASNPWRARAVRSRIRVPRLR